MHFTAHWGGGNWLYVSYTISKVSACVPISLSGGISCAHLTLWGKRQVMCLAHPIRKVVTDSYACLCWVCVRCHHVPISCCCGE